jgi:glycosyltransferase involved in cell wall biosynthesis
MRCAPRVLFISQSTSHIVFDLARRVAREIGPTLLISGNSYPLEREDRLEVWQGPAYNNSTATNRFLSWWAFMAWATFQAMRVRGRSVVLLNSNPPFLPWLGWILKRVRGWPYLVVVLDIYPEAVFRMGFLRETHPVIRAWYALNRIAYRAADVMVSLAPVMCDVLSRQVPAGKPIDCIPNWVDPNELRPLPKSDNPVAAEYGQQAKLTVLYSGNLGSTHDVSGLFGAVDLLRDDTDIEFVFVGGGSRRAELEQFCTGRPNARLLPFQPAERVRFTLAMGDVSVVALGRGSEGISMPSKAYYMMSAGCALLGLSTGRNDVSGLIKSYRCGVNVDSGDAAGVCAAVRRFRDDPEFLAGCRRHARIAAQEAFSKDVIEPRYLEHLRRLAESCG